MVANWGVNQSTLWTADPVRYAKAAVATIGIKSFTRGYYPHAIMVGNIATFPCKWALTTYKFDYIIMSYLLMTYALMIAWN